MKSEYTPTEYKALIKKARSESTQAKAFRHIMRCHEGIVEEYRFDITRRFRFDYAIPEKMIGIEFEGIISEKSRHTTLTGYTRDTTKYNLAAVLGWKVLRYTALKYKDVWNDLKRIKNAPNVAPR